MEGHLSKITGWFWCRPASQPKPCILFVLGTHLPAAASLQHHWGHKGHPQLPACELWLCVCLRSLVTGALLSLRGLAVPDIQGIFHLLLLKHENLEAL